jgi:hypothetical protein
MVIMAEGRLSTLSSAVDFSEADGQTAITMICNHERLNTVHG